MDITVNTTVVTETVVPPSEAVSFGALTLAGDGGFAKPAGAAAISDAGGTNLVLSGGFAVPDTGGTVSSGTVTWDDSTIWTVIAEANTYSITGTNVDTSVEWDAVIALGGATLAGKTIKAQPGATLGRISAASLAMTGTITVDSHDANDPGQITEISLSSNGAAGSFSFQNLLIDNSLIVTDPNPAFAIIILDGAGGGDTFDSCEFIGRFDPADFDGDLDYKAKLTVDTVAGGTLSAANIGNVMRGPGGTERNTIYSVQDDGGGNYTVWVKDNNGGHQDTARFLLVSDTWTEYDSADTSTTGMTCNITAVATSAISTEEYKQVIVQEAGHDKSLTITNSNFHNCGRPVRSIGRLIFEDNTVDTVLGDGINSGAANHASPPMIDISRSVFSGFYAQGSDMTNPHSDVFQPDQAVGSTSSWTGFTLDENVILDGSGRETAGGFFLNTDSPGQITAKLRNNIGEGGGANIEIQSAKDCEIYNSIAVRSNTTETFTVLPNITIGSASDGGGNKVYNCAAELFSIGNAAFDNNITLVDGSYSNAFTPTDYSAKSLTLAEILTRYTPKPSGTLLDGASYVVGDTGCVTSAGVHQAYDVASIPAGPLLTTPVDSADGDTASIGTVTTNTGNGTLYWLIDESVTPPTAANLKLGNITTGVAADDSGSGSVTATGAQNIAGSGLTAETTYYTYFMHEDSGTDQSAVASADGFTTEVAGFYSANATLMTGDYMATNTLNTNSPAASKKALISFWMYHDGTFGTADLLQVLTSSNQPRVKVSTAANGRLNLSLTNSSSTVIASMVTANSTVAEDVWTHVMWDVDTTTGTERNDCWVNGTKVSSFAVSPAIVIDGEVEGALPRLWFNLDASTTAWDIAYSDVWVMLNNTLDMNTQTNREKFILAGKPVNLGSDGSTPTTVAPFVFYRNPYTSWNVDVSGSGNTLPVTGTLAPAVTSPSD